MYPAPRMFWQLFRHRKDPPIGPFGTHVSQHICWPWDLDVWLELNNGFTLTLYDLGRIPLAVRNGVHAATRRLGYRLTVAGSTVRYRRRIQVFDRLVMKSRLLGWDDKFLYNEQSMWRPDGVCANHVVLRTAIVGRKGMVPPAELAREMGHDGPSPALPPFVQAWSAAEAQRPWPPMQD